MHRVGIVAVHLAAVRVLRRVQKGMLDAVDLVPKRIGRVEKFWACCRDDGEVSLIQVRNPCLSHRLVIPCASGSVARTLNVLSG